MRSIAISVLLTLVSLTAEARDHKALREFQRDNPCPATHKRRNACPGWIIDHVIPLCAGGADHKANMQWQTVTDAKVKDVQEKRQCAKLRKRPV